MAAGEFNDLRHFCFRHLVGEDAADAHAVAVDMQHHLHRFLAALVEESSPGCERRTPSACSRRSAAAPCRGDGFLVLGRVLVTMPVPVAVSWPVLPSLLSLIVLH